ncbi:FecR family protein [Flagellimonas crocea]|uniref:FecR family protein n=1 Tax=Flagellimonas crocea TaxID=3067311 RepID=UPI00296F04DF|nr:FecR domain-containing protein [Muricauda sp. DH64]
MDQDTLIQKWLNNNLSEEERKAFDTMEDATFYKNIVADASHFKASNFSVMADYEAYKERSMEADTKVRKLQWLKPVMRVASIIVAALGLYFIFTFNSLTEVQTQVAEKTTIDMPDASQVILNAKSEIAFNEKSWDSKREIKLDGEAFFDVAKGSKFDVVTQSGIVSVLGTEFNVKHRGSFFEVACFEGTVQVATSKGTVILKVGDNVSVINGVISTGKNTFDGPQWTKNKSYFQRTPVSEVFAELERQYGVTVNSENVNTAQLFTGGFNHDDLSRAIKAIGEPLAIDYQILDNDNIIFSKRD